MSNIRYIARFDIETTTPLTVRSGEKSLISDQLIYRDAFGLPSIRGTSLAGVLRSLCRDLHEQNPSIFGIGEEEVKERKSKIKPPREEDDLTAQGSKVWLSSACLIGSGNRCVQTLEDFWPQREDLKVFATRMERDRVRINHRGVVDGSGKFDEEILPRGARFRFEIGLKGTAEDLEHWHLLLDTIHQSHFVVGGGTRSGRGQFKVLACQTRQCDLSHPAGQQAWLGHSADLNQNTGFAAYKFTAPKDTENWQSYTLQLQAKDFFLAGAGHGAKKEGMKNDINKTYKAEPCFVYENGKPGLSKEEYILLPATSIKGALAHRVAYHYNCKVSLEDRLRAYEENALSDLDVWLEQTFARRVKEFIGLRSFDNASSHDFVKAIGSLQNVKDDAKHEISNFISSQKHSHTFRIDQIQENHAKGLGNKAVETLFGFAKNSTAKGSTSSQDGENEEPLGRRGRVLVHDVYIPESKTQKKLFNHVKIDRFTSGASDSALFNELTVSTKEVIALHIRVEKEALQDEQIKEAFENAIKDLESGHLPLGGGVTKGHGVFKTVKQQ
jgi:CRISPR/Cas system CMR subunit Cmr4 (Cas7 group RAMP superfamily)